MALALTVAPLTGASYFGYPIYISLYLDGDCAVSGGTVKAASPDRWSSAIEYDSGWITVSGKSGGTNTRQAEQLRHGIRADFVRFPQVMPRLMSQIERIPHRTLELHVTGEQGAPAEQGFRLFRSAIDGAALRIEKTLP